MNFIPRRFQQRQSNQRLLRRGLAGCATAALGLAAASALLLAANHWLGARIAGYEQRTAALNELMRSREAIEGRLQQLQQVAGELDDLQSFATLAEDLALLARSQPAAAALQELEVSFDERGDALLLLSGTVQHYAQLSEWQRALRDEPRVDAVELLASNTQSSAGGSAIEQRFQLQLRTAAVRTGDR